MTAANAASKLCQKALESVIDASFVPFEMDVRKPSVKTEQRPQLYLAPERNFRFQG